MNYVYIATACFIHYTQLQAQEHDHWRWMHMSDQLLCGAKLKCQQVKLCYPAHCAWIVTDCTLIQVQTTMADLLYNYTCMCRYIVMFHTFKPYAYFPFSYLNH